MADAGPVTHHATLPGASGAPDGTGARVALGATRLS